MSQKTLKQVSEIDEISHNIVEAVNSYINKSGIYQNFCIMMAKKQTKNKLEVVIDVKRKSV